MVLDKCFAELVIVISNNICGIAAFSEPAGCGFSPFLTVLKKLSLKSSTTFSNFHLEKCMSYFLLIIISFALKCCGIKQFFSQYCSICLFFLQYCSFQNLPMPLSLVYCNKSENKLMNRQLFT